MSAQKKPKVRRRCAAVLVALILALSLSSAALADTDENTPRLVQQPDQLVLQLGARWAGVEFELRTDAGAFPVPVVVDESGVLTMDLGGSTTYTLSCLNSEVPIPDPVPDSDPDPDPEQTILDQPSPVPQPSAAPIQSQNTPVFPVILFLAGMALAGGGLTALYFAKRSQQEGYDDWEDEEEGL